MMKCHSKKLLCHVAAGMLMGGALGAACFCLCSGRKSPMHVKAKKAVNTLSELFGE